MWLWHPFLSGDGQYMPSQDAAVGPRGAPVPPPGGMAEFTFDCAVRETGLSAALERLESALGRAAWDGVFLDKIRWPSPSADPVLELACFCDACRAAAPGDGIDLDAVASALAETAATPRGRLALVAALLGVADSALLESFLGWRCERISAAVEAAVTLIGQHRGPGGDPMRVALDVFAPSLAGSVGQDLASLAPLGEFTKAMLYLGTHGPAGLSFELCRLARWLADGGVASPAARLGELLGYPLPEMDDLCRASLSIAAFETELARLRERAGAGSSAGIDAVRIEGLAVLDDVTLARAVGAAAAAQVGIVLSWDLWSVPPERLDLIARTIEAAGTARMPA